MSTPLTTPTRRRPQAALLFTMFFASALLQGCASIEPWVKPYEREHLADPIMALDPNPVSSAYREHVFEVREAARGAMGGAGGGCGCN